MCQREAWSNTGGRLLRAAPEQLRIASEQEMAMLGDYLAISHSNERNRESSWALFFFVHRVDNRQFHPVLSSDTRWRYLFTDGHWKIAWQHYRFPPLEQVSRSAADLREEARQAHEDDKEERADLA